MSLKAVNGTIGIHRKAVDQKHTGLIESVFCFLFLMIIFFVSIELQVDGLVDLNGRTSRDVIGDGTAVITIPLEDQENTGGFDLKFSVSGCFAEVFSGDKLLYECGRKAAKEWHFIGRRYISVPLDDHCEKITIKLTAHDMGAKTVAEDFRLCPRSETIRYYLVNRSIGLFPAVLFIAIVLFLPIVSLSISIEPIVRRAGLYASGIFLCFSAVLLDAGGHYLVFIADQQVWNIIHEFAIYLLPFFVLLFFRELEIAEFQRNVILSGAVKDMLFVLIAAVSGFSGILSFDVLSVIFHYSLIIDGAIGIYGVYWNIKNPRISAGQKTILFVLVGWVVAIVTGYTVSKAVPDYASVISFDYFGPVSILVFYIFIFIYIELISGVEREYRKMEKDLEMSRIQNFNSQMQPHFLYNALSSIRQIVYEDPDYAASLISDFTRHLRGTIRAMSNDQPIPFSEELKNIKAYVSIEKVRFGEKLTVSYDIQADDFEIIPLSVQPLIENAIRHGIYRRGEAGGVVTLSSKETKDLWIVEVTDNGVGFDVQKLFEEVDTGVRDSTGLKNLIFRLENLLDAKVQIESIINKGTEITISIPKRVEGKK